MVRYEVQRGEEEVKREKGKRKITGINREI